MPAHILVIDDEPDIRELLSDILSDEGYAVGTAANAAAGRSQREAQTWDLVLLDIWMPDTDGLTLLREWKEGGRLDVPVVMMSGHGTIETAVEATRLGAYDFIEKPISLAKLLITIERAIEAQRLRSDNQALRLALSPAAAPLGDSTAMRTLRSQLERLAQHDAPVLLRGEAGTGKETLARWMHQLGPRCDQPFVTVAAGAIAEERAAATLFGEESEQGVVAGLLEHAESGTLYLDEVAELSAELQLRLSSVLERREILRVGARQPIPLRARIIAASAKDLDEEVASGRLREALFYQLNVLPVSVPALRERPDDLPLQAQSLLENFAQRDRLPLRQLSLGAQTRLKAHLWPGNLRELRGLMQRLLVLGGETEIGALELDHALSGTRTSPVNPVAGSGLQIDLNQPLREARDQFERTYLLHWLDESEGSVGKLAKAAGMERTHLYRKLRDLGIDLRGARDN
ncbi:MAG: Transcriptional regulatory protein QseF [Alphaproteobacteria bacterium ADurb.BinA280]|jgi:two-component system, NtrC family, nitrogen regulation response regulator NtrX|nr:sigma-54-dependent Fis family transcriptional regulator [Aquimonas sp.]OPZ12750.1 MAG: Transcriptional regulatory protein QseF [Alphaproteobacteria bacterium ADurb.BinA280]